MESGQLGANPKIYLPVTEAVPPLLNKEGSDERPSSDRLYALFAAINRQLVAFGEVSSQ